MAYSDTEPPCGIHGIVRLCRLTRCNNNGVAMSSRGRSTAGEHLLCRSTNPQHALKEGVWLPWAVKAALLGETIAGHQGSRTQLGQHVRCDPLAQRLHLDTNRVHVAPLRIQLFADLLHEGLLLSGLIAESSVQPRLSSEQGL